MRSKSNIIIFHRLLITLAFCLSGNTAFCLDESEMNALLSGPATAVVKNGFTYQGKLSRTDQGDLRILIESDGGEAILTFPREEIEAVIFPGAALISLAEDWVREGSLGEAQPVLRALYRQRRSFLPFLTDSERLLLSALPEASLLNDQPEDAIAIARNLLPYITSDPLREKLRATVLLGHYRLGLKEEAKDLATEWIGRQNLYGNSALGWWVRAKIDFEEKNFTGALWTSLHPIVFSGQMPMDYLSDCYALAIAASHELQKEAKAHLLYSEMQTRGIHWPEEELFAHYRLLYDEKHLDPASQ